MHEQPYSNEEGEKAMKPNEETHITCGFLDINDRHPELYGDCILLRDFDGIGFSLGHKGVIDKKGYLTMVDSGLNGMIGEYVEITIKRKPTDEKRNWLTDSEKSKDAPQT